MTRLLLILVLGLVLRLVNLNQSLWLDEAISINSARNFSVVELLTKFSPGDFHPPLYYLMLKLWVGLFGFGEVAARMLSVIFGVATIYMVYLIARELSRRVTLLHKGVTPESWALLSALFLATAPLHIYYSQEARMYVPATFFASSVVLFFLKLLKKQSRSLWIGLVLASVLLLYTNYLPGFLFLALILYLIVFERPHLKKHAKEWLFTLIAVAVSVSLWLPTFLQQLQSGLAVKTNDPQWWNVLGRTSLKQIALVPLKFTIGRIPVDSSYYHVGAITVISTLFVGLFYKAAKIFRETKFLWLWLLVPALSVAILGLRLPIFSYFRLLFLLPAFYLLLAVGAFSFKRETLRWASVTLILLVNIISSGIYLFNPRFHREDWRSAVSFIESRSEENSATLFVGEGQREPYKYYAKTVPSFGPDGLSQGPFDTIYLMRYVQPILDLQDILRQKVEESGYRKLGEYDFNGVVVWEYKKI